MECRVATDIRAPAERVWSLLTDAPGMTDWNSTLTSIEGPIELGGTVKMQVPEAPGRTFAPKVTRFEANRTMEWREGNPLFGGIRTYTLTPAQDGRSTGSEMTEVFSGLMPLTIAGRLPDFGPIFERYAADPEGASGARTGPGSIATIALAPRRGSTLGAMRAGWFVPGV